MSAMACPVCFILSILTLNKERNQFEQIQTVGCSIGEFKAYALGRRICFFYGVTDCAHSIGSDSYPIDAGAPGKAVGD